MAVAVALIAATALNRAPSQRHPAQPSPVVDRQAPEPAPPAVAAPPAEDPAAQEPPVAELEIEPKRGVDDPEIRGFLDRWAAAAQIPSADTQAQFYAPTVDVFYFARNVTRDDVRRRLEEARHGPGGTGRVEIGNVETRLPAPHRAVVTFDRISTRAGRGERRKVRTQLVLLKTSAGWQISSERDVGTPRGGA
jgi:hypothetical protein